MAFVQTSLPNRWQDKATVALSILLVVSPWLLGYTDLSNATLNAVILGGAMAAGAVSLIAWEPYWPGFFTAFAAFWLILSPRILDFSSRIVPATAAIVIGAAVLALALWSAIGRSRAQYFATHPGGRNFDPPAQPPSTPSRKAA